MKTVYPDSSRYDVIHNSGPNDPLSTIKAKKLESDNKIKEALGCFSIEILSESLETLHTKMDRDIEKIKKKYMKIMDPIQTAMDFKIKEQS